MHAFEYYDPVHEVSLNGKTMILTIELSKVDMVVEKPVEVMDTREHWAVYFRYLTDKSKRRKINQILEKEEGIAMASEVLITVSKDEIERARLLSEYKYQVDTQSKIVYAKRQGIKEGMEKGEKRGTAKAYEDIARKALAEGVSIELIQKITGLDKAAIKNLTP